MENKKSKDLCLPATGEVLAFIIHCLGVAKDNEHFNYSDFKRLQRGGLGPDKYWEVVRKTMDAIVAMFLGDEPARKALLQTLIQRGSAPIRKYHLEPRGSLVIPVAERYAPRESLYWKYDESGKVCNFREILLHDWTEFLEKHDYLIRKCGGVSKTGAMSFACWLNMFAIPFLAASLYEYQYHETDLESGMPGGQLWYIPYVADRKIGQTEGNTVLPIPQVLKWWEDLLGQELKEYSGLLCDEGDSPENAKRQVTAWRCEGRTPDLATIERWCKVPWVEHYKGTFVDDKKLNVRQRWERCRSFLIRKGFYPNKENWLDECDPQSRAAFSVQYRGELLEKEILPFREYTFEEFFYHINPMAAGLPVEDLIERVAKRYSMPSNSVLKARLMIAAGFQRAFKKLVEFNGEGFALVTCLHFSRVFNYIVDLHRDGNDHTSVWRRIQETPSSMAQYRACCDWLYEEHEWNELVNCMVKTTGGVKANLGSK